MGMNERMKWIDGNEINMKQFTREALSEKLVAELHDYDYIQYLAWADFFQVAAFLIEFDTELSINGIFGFLENSIGHYSPNIIQAFRAIGDDNDADTLEEICHLAPPNSIRAEFISNISQEYEITSFHDNHEMAEKVEEQISRLSEQLYLYGDFDIWPLLFKYLDEHIAQL